MGPVDRGWDESARVDPGALLDHLRGLMLGLMLADRECGGGGTGTLTQLMCFGMDALVRAQIGADGAADDPLREVRAGILRWAAATGRGDVPLTGWVVDHPELRRRHDDVDPALLAALDGLAEGRHLADNDSAGAWGALLPLPLAAYAPFTCPRTLAGWAQAAAGLTHGHPEAWTAAGFVGVLVGAHLVTATRSPVVRPPLEPTIALRWLDATAPRDPLALRVRAVLREPPGWAPGTLARHAPDDSATSTVVGALYLAPRAAGRGPDELRALAEEAAQPRPVAALSGALAGLEGGVDRFGTADLARHDLTWAVDTLVRDLGLSLWQPPGRDDARVGRYPPQATPEPYNPRL